MIVVDASIAASWCFEDEASGPGDELLDQVARLGAVVPSLWHLEIGNILRQAERRKRIAESSSQQKLQLLAGLPIETDAETSARAWSATLLLARRHTLTVYDAAYLELALRRGLPLASKDHDLLAAAQSEGVATVTC